MTESDTKIAPENIKKPKIASSKVDVGGGDAVEEISTVAPAAAPEQDKVENSSDLNQVRGRIFSGGIKLLKRELVDFLGEPIEIRQPTIDQVNRLANLKDSENPLVHVLVEFCYIPGTDIKVFTSGDKDSILNLPAGEWVTKINEAINKMTGVDIKEAEKNLSETV